jgi:hypothetical protein
MAEIICALCGHPMKGGTCSSCQAATAIATPEISTQVKVTPVSSADGAFREGVPQEQTPMPPIQPVGGWRTVIRRAFEILTGVLLLALAWVFMYLPFLIDHRQAVFDIRLFVGSLLSAFIGLACIICWKRPITTRVWFGYLCLTWFV